MRKNAPYASGSVARGVGVMSMDYLGGFQYQGTALKFFPTAEGYVQATALKVGFAYSYVYNYTDHLGNIRLSYAQDPENPNVLKIIEESHYYPFGLKHTNYNSDKLAFKEKDPGPGIMLAAIYVQLKIQSSTAKEGEKKMTKEALSKYSILFNNCGQAVCTTLNKLGIRTVDLDRYKYGGYSAGTVLYNGIVSNEMYYNVKEANKNIPRTILTR